MREAGDDTAHILRRERLQPILVNGTNKQDKRKIRRESHQTRDETACVCPETRMHACEATIDAENCCGTHETAVYHDRMQIADLLNSSGLTRLDGEILLGYTLKKSRTWIIAHADEEVTQESIEAFHRMSERRRAGEPIAYITGVKEFYGRDFIVTPATLIPRPATESLIDLTKDFLRQPKNRTEVIDTDIVGIARVLSAEPPKIILDIGTGSGCIAITLALEGVKEQIIAVDTSKEAIEVAKKNADEFHIGEKVILMHESGESVIRSMKHPFLVVSNPPYIPMETQVERTVMEYEPHTALFAGTDGMDVIQSIVDEAKRNPHCVGVILECKNEQKEAIDSSLNARVFV